MRHHSLEVQRRCARLRPSTGLIALPTAPIEVRADLSCVTPVRPASFKTETFSVTGEIRDFPLIADSGSAMHRRFCPTRGTHLFSEAESRPHLIFVRVGTLDNRELARPVATIWTSAAPTWACLDERLPKIAGQPPPPA